MAFNNINREKFFYLLLQGTHDDEVKKFLLESRLQLIMRGAKRLQNLPQGRDARIRAVCERLPSKTDDIVRDWFSKNISLSEPAPVSDVLTYLELHFDGEETLPDVEAHVVARSALVYLFQDPIDPGLLEFMQRKPGETAVSDETPGNDTDTDEDNVAFDDEQSLGSEESLSFQVAELLASVIATDDSAIEEALSPFPEAVRVFVEALFLAADGKVDAAEAKLPMLEPGGAEIELVRRAISRATHTREPRARTSGIRVKFPKKLDSPDKMESYDIIGMFTNESTKGAVFVHPLYVVMENNLYALDSETCHILFPESGDVMTHRSLLHRSLLKRELVRWNVSEREDAGGDTHFHMETELPPIIGVATIPAPSTDPDEVRERIKHFASVHSAEINRQIVFLLSDSVAVAPQRTLDMSKEEAFEQPWQAWSALDTWLIEGRQYCLELPSESASTLDLSSLDTAFRKLLNDIDADKAVPLSRAQKRELAAALREHTGVETLNRARRVASALDRIALEGDELDHIVELLNSRDEVHRRVDQLIAEDFERRKKEKDHLQNEVDSLESKKSALDGEIKNLKRASAMLTNSTTKSVQEAFGKAIDEGVTSLTNAKIFQTLSGATQLKRNQQTAIGLDSRIETWTLDGSISLAQAVKRLAALGLGLRDARILGELWALASRSQISLVLFGQAARQYVQILAQIDCESVGVVAIPMGLTSSALVSQALSVMPDADRVVVLDSDVSPIELYGGRILDVLLQGESSSLRVPTPILFSCLGNSLALPLPQLLRRFAVVVDVDSLPISERPTDDELEDHSIPLLPHLRKALLDSLPTVDDDVRAHVAALLMRAFSSSDH